MPKTLLGIIGSPRKHGNSELFIKELYGHLSEDWELKLLRLPEMNIRSCRACYQCLFGEMQCPMDDDLSTVMQSLIQCDAYVVATPTYLLGANSSLKRFLDRGLSFYAQIEGLWGKPAVGVAIAGIEGLEGHTKLDVEGFIKLTMGDLRGSEVVYGALPGEIFLKEGGRPAAKRLAEALTADPWSPPSPQVPTCTVCGGDTVRFLPGGQVRCMLCSSSGSYEWKEDRLHLRTEPGKHSLFTSFEAAKRHAEWLREMKDLFMARRKELKAVSQPYTQIGSWIRPRQTEDREVKSY
jgi:multimeric flavodoxin WrbA